MTRIAIFDSGVGGLSIYKEIKQQLPDSQYIFVSDNQSFPYGTKPEQELIDRVQKVVTRIINQFNPDILVIACNTASTIVLPLLRKQFDLPIVGVVPAIKPAAQLSKSKIIGLLATPATIKRPYTDQLISKFAADCNVVSVGSSRLVEIAENKLFGITVNQKEIEQILQPFLVIPKIDLIILACTHFPLINKDIRKVFKAKYRAIDLIDSGQGIANRVVELINDSNLERSNSNISTIVFTESHAANNQFESELNRLGFDKRKLLK